jgi:protein-arginine kinase activator protein McsA
MKALICDRCKNVIDDKEHRAIGGRDLCGECYKSFNEWLQTTSNTKGDKFKERLGEAGKKLGKMVTTAAQNVDYNMNHQSKKKGKKGNAVDYGLM